MKYTIPTEYEKKFAEFIQMCAKAKADSVQNVIVATPHVIGDTYDEVIESLSRLADAGLTLHIAKR